MNKQLLILIIFLAAAGFIGWQYLLPEFNGAIASREELSVWREKFNEAQNLKAKLSDLEKKYAKMANEAGRVSQAIPVSQDIPGLLVQLEELSSQNGLILQEVNFSVVEAKKSKTAVAVEAAAAGEEKTGVAKANSAPGGVKTLAIGLSLNGTQPAFMSFLKSIENNLRIMDVSSIDFSTEKSETGASANQDFKISLNTYFRQ